MTLELTIKDDGSIHCLAPDDLDLTELGPVSVAIGLAVQMRYPGLAGDTVLTAAVAAAVLGEFAGAPALRAALARGVPPASPPAPGAEVAR